MTSDSQAVSGSGHESDDYEGTNWIHIDRKSGVREALSLLLNSKPAKDITIHIIFDSETTISVPLSKVEVLIEDYDVETDINPLRRR